MIDWGLSLLISTLEALWDTFYGLVIPAIFFALIGYLVKREQLFADVQKAWGETRCNVLLLVFHIILIKPIGVISFIWIYSIFSDLSFQVFKGPLWEDLPRIGVIFAAVFIGDFIGYLRHRFEHTQLLWPAHAIHHSDTQMAWLATSRFHPINRMTTLIIDNAALILLGFPAYALIANNLVRHYYGFFIHADLPWTYGRLSFVFVSPVMHRWHHSADPLAFNTNFATVFSIFDRLFGTLRVPGPCNGPLGVTDDIGNGVISLLSYPFKARAYKRLHRRLFKRAY